MIHCSFVSHTSMDLDICASKGSLHVKDFIIPFQEHSASFDFTLDAKFVDLHIGWNVKPEDVGVASQLPQEALMVQELARLVEGISKFEFCPDIKWPEISRKTVSDGCSEEIHRSANPLICNYLLLSEFFRPKSCSRC